MRNKKNWTVFVESMSNRKSDQNALIRYAKTYVSMENNAQKKDTVDLHHLQPTNIDYSIIRWKSQLHL